MKKKKEKKEKIKKTETDPDSNLTRAMGKLCTQSMK